ncbi:MAG: ATPase AAA [Pirellulaceae bacterium]|nr:MAG: ATPase AAA [Pirellulaceae bacterium]
MNLIMAEPLVEQVLQKIDQVRHLYHRLVLLVGPSGSGKTSALQGVAARASAPLLNVNLELSCRMLDLTERQRALQVPRLLQDVCASSVERHATNVERRASCVDRHGSEVLLLDNVEILFDVKLKQDPLRLLQGLSRNRTIVAAWPGRITGASEPRHTSETVDARRTPHDAGRYLTYAVPDHPEYRRYLIRDLVIVDALSVGRHASGGQA